MNQLSSFYFAANPGPQTSNVRAQNGHSQNLKNPKFDPRIDRDERFTQSRNPSQRETSISAKRRQRSQELAESVERNKPKDDQFEANRFEHFLLNSEPQTSRESATEAQAEDTPSDLVSSQATETWKLIGGTFLNKEINARHSNSVDLAQPDALPGDIAPNARILAVPGASISQSKLQSELREQQANESTNRLSEVSSAISTIGSGGLDTIHQDSTSNSASSSTEDIGLVDPNNLNAITDRLLGSSKSPLEDDHITTHSSDTSHDPKVQTNATASLLTSIEKTEISNQNSNIASTIGSPIVARKNDPISRYSSNKLEPYGEIAPSDIVSSTEKSDASVQSDVDSLLLSELPLQGEKIAPFDGSPLTGQATLTRTENNFQPSPLELLIDSSPFQGNEDSDTGATAANRSFSSVPLADNHSVSNLEYSKSALPGSAIATSVIEQVIDELRTDILSASGDSKQKLSIEIHPAELGRLEIYIGADDDNLNARIIATESVTSELLNREKMHLVNALKEQGINLPDVNISHHDPRDQDQQSFNSQRRENQQNYQQNRSRGKELEPILPSPTDRNSNSIIDLVA